MTLPNARSGMPGCGGNCAEIPRAAPSGDGESPPARGTSPAPFADVSGSTDSSPRCSVIIPTYNRAHSVGEAITSVLRQTMDDFECIVVDDGSTDPTSAVLTSFTDPRMHVISGRHAGVAAARNLGVAQAQAPLIAFLDSDDLRRNAFEKAGRFDETWSSSEDWEFLLRFAHAHRFGYIDLPLAVLRVGDDSLHRLDQARGDSAMIRLLLRERPLLRDDREARAAVQRGLVTRVKHFGWHHRDAGRRRAAAAVFLRGFVITLSPGLLVRALAALLGLSSGWQPARAARGHWRRTATPR